MTVRRSTGSVVFLWLECILAIEHRIESEDLKVDYILLMNVEGCIDIRLVSDNTNNIKQF